MACIVHRTRKQRLWTTSGAVLAGGCNTCRRIASRPRTHPHSLCTMRQQRPLGPLPQPSSAHATAQDLWVEGEAVAVAETRVRGSKRRLDAGARAWLHGGLVAEVQSGREGCNRVSVETQRQTGVWGLRVGGKRSPQGGLQARQSVPLPQQNTPAHAIAARVQLSLCVACSLLLCLPRHHCTARYPAQVARAAVLLRYSCGPRPAGVGGSRTRHRRNRQGRTAGRSTCAAPPRGRHFPAVCEWQRVCQRPSVGPSVCPSA